jgi:hypothetical protein
MLSVGLWRWYINVTITFLDSIHRPVFYLKHDVSEIGFCLRLQVEPTELGQIDRASLCRNEFTNLQYIIFVHLMFTS